MIDAWYEEVSHQEPLSQGDLISQCPTVTWTSYPQKTSQADIDSLKMSIEYPQDDLVVMTQACDLANEKLSVVVLCSHYALNDYKASWEEAMKASGQNPTVKAWESLCSRIRDGFVWSLAFLNSGATSNVSTDVRVVDFSEIRTLPRSFIEEHLRTGFSPRLRLRPPYREHLSQAFARYFMRVGLPTRVNEVWKSTDARTQ
ncbi:MAG: hypothetical protein HZB26_20565 [Candidatus Hydrogenedentes bacterium]|nr:hypothetical protein [Candidatus Hydrogenedentota bacterium]